MQLFLLSRKLRAGRAARVTGRASGRNSFYPCIAASLVQYNSARKNVRVFFVPGESIARRRLKFRVVVYSIIIWRFKNGKIPAIGIRVFCFKDLFCKRDCFFFCSGRKLLTVQKHGLFYCVWHEDYSPSQARQRANPSSSHCGRYSHFPH